MNTNLAIKYNNKYQVELIDAVTKNIKQAGVFHNIPLTQFKRHFVGTPTYNMFNIFGQLRVGSGTSIPEASQTKLDSETWSISSSTDTYEWIDDYTLRGTATYTFPATSSYVGTVTEVGLCGRYFGSSSSSGYDILVTRALLTDSEGQVISFAKTETDILNITVTVEISLNNADSHFYLFPKPYLLQRILGMITPSSLTYAATALSAYGLGQASLNRFKHNLSDGSFEQALSIVGGTPKAVYTDTQAYVETSFKLLNTVVTEETYFMIIGIPHVGYWKLPNEDIFPAYTISGIAIGVGNGVDNIFENPINYFKKDTEKVYKNGTLLTRDVDYTINNMGNKDCLPEITQMAPAPIVRSDVDIAAYMGKYDISVRAIIMPGVGKSLKAYDMSKEAPVFNATYPLYIEYEEAVTMNCLKCNGWLYIIGSTGGYSNLGAGAIFYLDYSEDGEIYTEIGSVKSTAQNGVFTMDFADITAKYWRIRTSHSTQLLGLYNNNTKSYLTLNRKDPNIVFTEVPAEGDVITMDVDMDIIMKNENYIIESTIRLDFTM